MAVASPEIIKVLRDTVGNLQHSDKYQWGHMGNCNCGFLVQTITDFNKAEIHEIAMQRPGDWNQHVNDYCPESNLPIDLIIKTMIDLGFTKADIGHLERLSDNRILGYLPESDRFLRHNVKGDVIIYLKAWIGLLESEILKEVDLDLGDQIAEKPLVRS